MAANSSTIFASLAASQAASSVGQGFSQSAALRSKGEYEESLYNINRNFAELQATDAMRRGEKGTAAVRSLTRRTVGAQRAALAAQGIDVDSGSAREIQDDTRLQGALDELTVKNNAWREAWGFKVAAFDSGMRGQFARMSGDSSARSTLLTGGINAVNYGLQSYAYYKKG